MPAPKKGDIIACTFLDHVENANDPIVFTVYGRLVQQTKLKYVIDCWEYEGGHTEAVDDNQTRYTIVRSTVQKIVKLTEGK